MASFGKTPKRNKIAAITHEVNMSVSCYACNVRVSKCTYVPSDAVLFYDCENGHRGVIENFALDIVRPVEGE